MYVCMYVHAGDAAVQLSKYLLKTLCSDLVNMIVIYLAEDLGILTEVPTEITSKVIMHT